ncbi:superinfection immunity protein [Streptococcus raffinosi]|uniref:Superinfection immunity protein n=1 Tax=Streptococcus raffinosi TaxID=3053355 RepID=A0ABT7LTU6_9STRE|nr:MULTISPECIES: superinfection immunity protein [unclassified Streptococcus]MDL5044060.1 superinfection immunity protein [Streptococcus sp. VTCC 12812]MDM0095293.1 superinfection immunity protein [Streptococcus sp. VTCC 12813]
MNQKDWIDFFQAVNGRNPSIQEMADAAKRGEFVRESSKRQEQPVEVKKAEETVEIKDPLAPVEPAKTEETVETTPPKKATESVEPVVESYDVAEEPLVDSSIEERQTFQTPNLGQEAPTANFQAQVNPIQGTTNKSLNSFAQQTNASFQQTNSTFNEPWKKPEKKSPTNLIMVAIATIPVILWALGLFLLGVVGDESSMGLGLAFWILILGLPAIIIDILPALLNKTDKKWLIFVFSILLSWTFLGWLILLIVSINMNKEAERLKQQQMMMQITGEPGNTAAYNSFQTQARTAQQFQDTSFGPNSNPNNNN